MTPRTEEQQQQDFFLDKSVQFDICLFPFLSIVFSRDKIHRHINKFSGITLQIFSYFEFELGQTMQIEYQTKDFLLL